MKVTVENGLVIVQFEDTPRNQNVRLELTPDDAIDLSVAIDVELIGPDKMSRAISMHDELIAALRGLLMWADDVMRDGFNGRAPTFDAPGVARDVLAKVSSP